MFNLHKLAKFSLFINFLFLSICLYSQPFDQLIKKILKKDESINSSKIAIEKANNELSSTRALYTPKIDLTLPLGKEILINSDSNNTNYDFYEFSAKISQKI